MARFLISLLAVGSTAMAAVIGSPVGSGSEWSAVPTPTVTGAPSPAAFGEVSPAEITAAAGPFTVTIINNHGSAVKTRHILGSGASAPVGGLPAQGQIPAGATRQYAVPTGYSGNVAIWEAQYSYTDAVSLIEGTFEDDDKDPEAEWAFDVSYVDGFSVPITCRCNGGTVVTGCSKGLWGLNECGNPTGQGSCRNPHRNGPQNAATFFRPCAGAAYTFPDDHDAQSNGICNGQATCCIGTSCPANPNQN